MGSNSPVSSAPTTSAARTNPSPATLAARLGRRSAVSRPTAAAKAASEYQGVHLPLDHAIENGADEDVVQLLRAAATSNRGKHLFLVFETLS